MAYFDFKYLIEKYSTPFVLIVPGEGSYEGGEWKEKPPQKKRLTGAVLAHRERKVFRAEGTLTEQDRALYMLEPLTDALQGATVIHGGKEYSISDSLQNAEFTGVYAYTLKYVSVFDGGGENA